MKKPKFIEDEDTKKYKQQLKELQRYVNKNMLSDEEIEKLKEQRLNARK